MMNHEPNYIPGEQNTSFPALENDTPAPREIPGYVPESVTSPAPGYIPYSSYSPPPAAWPRDVESPQPAEPASPVQTEPAVSPAPKRKGHARLVAAMLAVSLLSGGAGGAAVYYALDSNRPAPVTVAAPAAPLVVNAGEPLQNIAALAEKASWSVVEVSTEVKAPGPFLREFVSEGAGSGVILSEDGYIVTNNHVIDGASVITVRLKDGQSHKAKLIGADEKTDLAVLKIDVKGLTPVTFADSDSVVVGELAVAIGNPLGTLGGTVTEGIISAKDRDISIGNQTMTLLQTSAAVNPGNSGGGLFDKQGDLVGIVNAKSSGGGIEGLGFAIPSNLVRRVTDDLMDKGYVSGRPQLGIKVLEANDPLTLQNYRLDEPGVYVVEVQEDNGLQPGDRIVRIGETEISTLADISKILREQKVGDVLEVEVVREEESVTVSVTLTEQIPEHLRQRLQESEKL